MTDNEISTGVSRRRLLQGGARALAFTSAIGIAPRFLRPAFADSALAPGMTGGPTGFAGSERHQYNESMPEGRAIEGIKKLKAAGKAPAKLVFQMSDGAIGQLNKPYPSEGPTVQQVWEKETGIQLELVGAVSGQEFTKAMQDISTRGGAFDVYQTEWNRVGDLAESGGIVKLDEFVERYRPEWDDPKLGYVGGKQTVNLFNTYKGSYYAVSLDGDYQTWIYRKDLFEDTKERADFKAKYGRELSFPNTWDELDEVAAFFNRPDKGLIGCSDLRNQGWGYTNWYQRYCSMAEPNQLLFDPKTAKPLINSPAGVSAAKSYVDSLKYHSPDAISWGWPEQYGSMGKGETAITCAFSNMPKFLDNATTKVQGRLASALPPGTRIGDKLVRRSVLWFSLTSMVSSQSKYPEATYLFLQWLGGTRIYSWMAANPAGYFDPHSYADLDDPLVIETYKPYHVPIIRETIKRAVPTINYVGVGSFHGALDENLVAACSHQITAEDAMARVEKSWTQTIRKVGEENVLDAIQAATASWPSVVD
jgi:multiple sugar transport system substrate-binding protein